MSRGHLSMRKIKEILRLKLECHCSHYLIACSVGVSSSTVSECLRRAREANISWPLPETRYQFSKWKKARPGADYHVELEQHFYSVPYTFIKKELDMRYTQTTVEIFYKSKRIASHVRSFNKNCHSTIQGHMPKRHQLYAEWTPGRIVRWAEKTGTATALLVEEIMASRRHPQQGFRSCFGILRLAKSYGSERLESACQRAIDIGAYSYKSVESILKNGLDKKPVPNGSNKTPVPDGHDYVRGQHYFH